MDKKMEQIEIIRHSLAHVMAVAIDECYDKPKFGVGPTVEHGFYYDFLANHTVSEEDLAKIEAKMHEVISRHEDFERKEWSIDEAKEYFGQYGQDFKVELLSDIKKFGTTKASEINADELGIEVNDDKNTTVTVYKTGYFVDLCRGPHVKNTKDLEKIAFKLTKVSGAYWRGDEKRQQLQRVYGVAFETKEELEKYLHNVEEAVKRDHRKLGKQLDLFVFSDLVGAGMPLWTPRGTVVRTELNNFVQQLRSKYGYEAVTIPHFAKKGLYEKSGHWGKFGDELFRVKSREEHEFAIKPMNCPHHAQIYASRPRSYRDLPIRYSETTMVYRDEQSGELLGLERVRSITQDDAHVFCRTEQIADEISKVWQIVEDFYKVFNIPLKVRFSRHDPVKMSEYSGDRKTWEEAENQLAKILTQKIGDDFIDGAGEAAFYGPKLDFMGIDSLGRELQVATIQLDFNQPQGFGLTCVNEHGEQEKVVMIHCAIMGSIERFMAVLIEHFAGEFPLWLAPEQARVIPVSENYDKYANEVTDHLLNQSVRVKMVSGGETLGKRIRESELMKVPYTLIVGEKEASSRQVSIRHHKDGDMGQKLLEKFTEEITKDIEKHK